MNVASFPTQIRNLSCNLRNGAAAGILPAAREASIASEYWYLPVTLPGEVAEDVANGIAAAEAVRPSDAIEAYIRSYFGIIAAATVPPRNTAIAVGDPDPAVDTAITAAGTSPVVRLKAITLGTARASIEDSWNIGVNEWSSTETHGASLVTVNRVVPAPGAVVPAGGELTLAAALRNPFNQMEVDFANGMTAITGQEWEYIFTIYQLAKVAPVLAGCQLLENNHHYLSSNTKATQAVEEQLFGSLEPTDPTSATWRANTVLIRDLVWHKAPHVVVTNVLTGLAIDDDVPLRLESAGLGSGAVRLPYIESKVRAAKAMIAVDTQVRMSTRAAGHKVGIPTLRAAVEILDTLGHQLAGAYNLAGYTNCTTRLDFVNGPLVTIMALSESVVAWEAGWYKSLLEAGSVNLSRNSVMQAYSIKRIVNTYAAQTADGSTARELWGRAQKSAAEKGDIMNLTIEI